MPGLLEQGMQQPPPGLVQQPAQALPVPGQVPGQMPPQPQEQVPAGAPKQKPTDRMGFDQKELDIFLSNGIKMIHTPNISDKIIATVANSKNPVQAISEVTLSIIARLEQSSAAKGKSLSFTVLAYGANVLMGEVITMAEKAGMKKMTKPEKYQAMSLATGKYLDNAVKTGKMTKEELAQLGEEAAGTEMGQKIMNYDPNNPPEQIEDEEEIPKKNSRKGKSRLKRRHNMGSLLAGLGAGLTAGGKAAGDIFSEQLKQQAMEAREMNLMRIGEMFADKRQQAGFQQAKDLQEAAQIHDENKLERTLTHATGMAEKQTADADRRFGVQMEALDRQYALEMKKLNILASKSKESPGAAMHEYLVGGGIITEDEYKKSVREKVLGGGLSDAALLAAFTKGGGDLSDIEGAKKWMTNARTILGGDKGGNVIDRAGVLGPVSGGANVGASGIPAIDNIGTGIGLIASGQVPNQTIPVPTRENKYMGGKSAAGYDVSAGLRDLMSGGLDARRQSVMRDYRAGIMSEESYNRAMADIEEDLRSR